MDKLRENEKNKEPREGSLFGRLSTLSRSAREGRRGNKSALIFDLLLFVLGFIVSRRHIIFGTRPLGTALVALLPIGVWQALLGVAVGAISLGGEGLGTALSAGLTVGIRLFLAPKAKKPFCEPLALRISASLLGGFISAVYGFVSRGFFGSSLVYGAFSVILPPIFVFMLSGIFDKEISLPNLFVGESTLSFKEKNEKERCDTVFFCFSAVLALFLISLSLAEYQLFGIGFSGVFSGVITLVCAKRLGALGALAVGFASSLGAAGIFSVSYALMGLVAGLAFGFGTGYAVVGGGAALSAWSGYSSGLFGLLSTLPEYSIAALIALPLLKGVSTDKKTDESEENSEDREARDMVGTMTLSFRARRSAAMDALEDAFNRISRVVKASESAPSEMDTEDIEALIFECAEEECALCDSLGVCKKERVFPLKKRAQTLAKRLSAGGTVAAEDINTDTEFCARSEALSKRISSRTAERLRERHLTRAKYMLSPEYSLVSQLICEARLSEEREREIDAPLTSSLSSLMPALGLDGGIIRAFGKRKKRFFVAIRDESGKKISSPELRKRIEDSAGVKLGEPEYFRRGKTALMECSATRAFVAECATASLGSGKDEISGDTVCAGETASDGFFAIISDGMGSGREAERTSRLCVDFLKPLLGTGAENETLIHLLNDLLRRRAGECSATLDLFLFDLVTGEAGFIKSGAAPSYIKRGGSVFRIKSRTAPLGLLESVDAEKIRADVRAGDLVILLSDGAFGPSEDAPWLLELLSAPLSGNLSSLADSILRRAKALSDSRDDMSVAVIKISESS